MAESEISGKGIQLAHSPGPPHGKIFYYKIFLYFPHKMPDHLAHPKTRFFIQRISYTFPKNPIFKSKTFSMPDLVPVFDAPPPLPPKKENTFLSRKPPKFSNENTFNVPMKESINWYTHLAHPKKWTSSQIFCTYIYIYIYIYPKKKFFKRKYFSHPLERTDVLPKRKNFLCLPKKITKEKISYNYQKTQSSKQGTNFPWLCKKLKRFTQIDFECCSAFFMLAKLNKLSDSAESYPTKTYSTRKTYKNLSNLQSFTKYLRQTLVLMWNNAVREKLDFYFSRDFY